MRHDIAPKESRGSCFYQSFPTPICQCEDLALASDIMTTQLGSTLNGGTGGTFLLNQAKCANIFSMIVEVSSYKKYSSKPMTYFLLPPPLLLPHQTGSILED